MGAIIFGAIIIAMGICAYKTVKEILNDYFKNN